MICAVPTITVLVKSYLDVKPLFLLDSRRIRHFCAAKVALEASFDAQKGEHRASVCRERRAHPKISA